MDGAPTVGVTSGFATWSGDISSDGYVQAAPVYHKSSHRAGGTA